MASSSDAVYVTKVHVVVWQRVQRKTSSGDITLLAAAADSKEVEMVSHSHQREKDGAGMQWHLLEDLLMPLSIWVSRVHQSGYCGILLFYCVIPTTVLVLCPT